MNSVRRVTLGLLLVAAMSSCHCHETEPQVPTTFTKAAGDQLSLTVGSAVSPTPLIVVKDAQGKGVPGIAITFAVGF